MSKLETPERISFWAKQRVEYLLDVEPQLYAELAKSGKLMEHLHDTEEKAQACYQKEVQKLYRLMELDPKWDCMSEEEKELRRCYATEAARDIVCNDWIWV
ncbi:MAG: TnpV protein [Oscillospiraceae bacterium]|nr:TnpV protein [Oscillospiraceae bacterium]